MPARGLPAIRLLGAVGGLSLLASVACQDAPRDTLAFLPGPGGVNAGNVEPVRVGPAVGPSGARLAPAAPPTAPAPLPAVSAAPALRAPAVRAVGTVGTVGRLPPPIAAEPGFGRGVSAPVQPRRLVAPSPLPAARPRAPGVGGPDVPPHIEPRGPVKAEVPKGPLPPLAPGNRGIDEAARRLYRVILSDLPPPVRPDSRFQTAAASISGVFYNPRFFAQIRRMGGDSALVGVLAHEIGHIRRGHVYKPKSTPQINRRRELEADQEAGCALANLKMDVTGYHDLTVRLAAQGSDTHPPGYERGRAIAHGHQYCWRGPGRIPVRAAGPLLARGPAAGPRGGFRGYPGAPRPIYGPPPGSNMLRPPPSRSYPPPSDHGEFSHDPFQQTFDMRNMPSEFKE